MFTIDRSSLRASTICRDYEFSQNHQKEYLAPSANANADASSDADADADADADVDAQSQLNTGYLDIDDDIRGTSDIDNPTLQSQDLFVDPSVNPFDLVSQTLLLLRPTPTLLSRSWSFQHFSEIVLEGQFYTPKGVTSQKTNIRRRCIHCN
jgi:hypothetical protein